VLVVGGMKLTNATVIWKWSGCVLLQWEMGKVSEKIWVFVTVVGRLLGFLSSHFTS
jgi:hypothetical protein